MSDRCYAIRIAGYGLRDADEVGIGSGAATPSNYSSSPDNRTLMIRFASFRPVQDGEGLWVPVLDGLPNELSWGINPRTGESITSTLSFSIQPTDQTRPFFLRSGWRKAANLTTALTSSDTTIYLDDGGALENQFVMIGQECIQLRTHNGGGEYDCYRGSLGTQAVAHQIGIEYDTEVFLANHGHNLAGRLVELTVVDGSQTSALLQDVEEVLWRGVLRTPRWADTSITFEAASILDLVRNGKVLRNQWRAPRVTWLRPGPNNPAQAYFRNVNDPTDTRLLQTRTPYFASGASTIISDGKKIIATPAENAVATPDAARLSSATALTLGLSDPLLPADFEGIEEVWEVFPLGLRGGYTNAGAANAKHPENDLPLSADPYILLLQLLTTTDSGGNGTYDVGPAKGLGLGIRSDIVDAATFVQLSASYGGLASVPDLVLGLKGESEDFWDLSRSLLAPYYQTLGVDAEGRITIHEFRDSSLIYYDQEFDDDDVPITSAPATMDPAYLRPLGRVDVRYGGSTGQGERSIPITLPQAVTRWPLGFAEEGELDLRGVGDNVQARIKGLQWLSRATTPIAAVQVDALPDVRLWPGDVARVTLGDIPGIEGSGAMSEEICLVVERAYSLDPWGVSYRFLRLATARNARQAGYHLAARVSSYDAMSGLAIIEANAFIPSSNHPAGWTHDSEAWAAARALVPGGGIAVDILDSDLSLRGSATVTSTWTDVLGLTGASVSPVAGDVIVATDYDTADGTDDTVLFEFFVYQADSNGTLGSVVDDAYSWGF